ncbi:MAG: 4Fe-4S dicluster domain-containing protein [Desulfobacterales bacterium]
MPMPVKFKGFNSTIKPDAGHRNLIEQGANADIKRCWTCGSCDFECPVNVATGILRPQKIVRMANLGMLDELLHEPAIWYCLACRRCKQICPNTVKPSDLIAHIRRISMKRNIISTETNRAYRFLFERFQRVRKRAVVMSFQGKLNSISDRQWCDWLLTPVNESRRTICFNSTESSSNDAFKSYNSARAAACFACGECSSACPVSCERSVFDPRALFRMFNLGLTDELLSSPAIWLCLDCGRCTSACSQLVDGRDIIRRLKDEAIQRGIIDRNFFPRLEQANRLVYNRWLQEVDALFGFNGSAHRTGTIGVNDFSACCRNYSLAVSI